MLYFDRIDVSEGINVNKQANQKSVIFVTIGVVYIKALSFKQMPATDAMIY